MPKQVIDTLIRALIKDIAANYRPGDRYQSIKEIAASRAVSSQTAQRAIRNLAERGWVRAAPRSGITVLSTEENRPLGERRMVLVSGNTHPGINNAYLAGAREAVAGTAVRTELVSPPAGLATSHIAFGRFLAALDADGIIGFVLNRPGLAFYHAVREGLDVVSDRAVPELPEIPSVELDGYRHAHAAGVALQKRGFRHLLVTGACDMPPDPIHGGTVAERFAGIRDGFGDGITYCNVMRPDSGEGINGFFRTFTPACAVYSLQSGTNWLAGSKFLEFRIRVTNGNFIVNNDLEGPFLLKGLPDIPAIAPSMKKQGAALAGRLLHKWRTGTFGEPVRHKI